MNDADIIHVLKQHAKDIRAGVSGGDGSEPGWHAANVLDYVADNFHEIAERQPTMMLKTGTGAIARLLRATNELVQAQRQLARAQREFDAAFADAETNEFERPHTAEGRQG